MNSLNTVESLISSIPDPEIPVITIKDLGILRTVRFEDGEYVVTITPTYTACPAMGWIEQQIKEILADRGINNVKVEQVYSPAWSTDWMSTDAKQKLKQYGIAPPKSVACTKSIKTEKVECPFCSSMNTELISYFGSTACKSLHKCNNCSQPFEHFKCH